jgi:hypothetical protein
MADYAGAALVRIRCVGALVASVALASVVTWAATKGPDAGGYTGTDTVVYSFVDISGASGGANILAGTDDGTSVLTVPFTFQFYGQPFTLVCVSSNGALYFVTSAAACTGLTDFANTDISATSTPNDLPAVLPLWSDLTFQVSGAGAVFYQTLGAPGTRRFVVQWNNAYPQGSPNPVTFQVILSEGTNAILFQYKTVGLGPGNPASNGAQATVGIRNTGALTNHEEIAWSYDAAVIGDSTALQFSGASPCASDVSGSIAVTRSGFTYNFATQRFSQTVKLTNTSASPISGPISLELNSLSSNAVLFNASGTTTCAAPVGSPYVRTNASTLAPGAAVSVVLQFTNPTKASTTYMTRVLAGSGAL